MSKTIHAYILSRLQQRKDEGRYRTLKLLNGLIDFTSNDYLGLAHDSKLQAIVAEETNKVQCNKFGSTGSRLLSGNSYYAEMLEQKLAAFHHAEAALLFNSGFDANYGLLSTLPYISDTILYDELVHASIHDGIRNSKASSIPFAHNNLEDLEHKITKAHGRLYVVVESIFSMNGDTAPLNALVKICEQYDAGLIVDEAHATGIFGAAGKGLVVELGIESNVLARVHTFGKAIGASGAAIVSSQALKDFLINYCRPFIFSTAPPLHTLAAINCAYDLLQQEPWRLQQLKQNIMLFKSEMSKHTNIQWLPSDSPIQSIIFPGNENVKSIANALQQQGLDVRPILSPTVPKGQERIRICLHTFNTKEEVIKLASVIGQF
ncbi:MAG: 8-amino-7-oxononanoate synthase [Bacteroidetes bacterium]|nr:8-amino-7-oxononanoate synthase [Bacteroidota bacterium]